MLRSEPALAEDLLDRITDATIVYLNAQVAAGAQVLQVFDSWAGALNGDLFERYSMPRLRRICEEVHGAPMIMIVAVAISLPPPQQSPMFGQRASSHTVASPRLRTVFRSFS